MNMKSAVAVSAVCLLAFLGWRCSNQHIEPAAPVLPALTLWDIGFVPCIPVKTRPIASVSYTSSSGATEELFALKKPLIIHFWAPWCAPCRAELPHFSQFVQANPGSQIWCVADNDQTPQSVQSFYQKQKLYGLPVMIDGQQKLARRLNVEGLPTTVFFDSEGRERGRIVGPVMWNKPEVASLILKELLS